MYQGRFVIGAVFVLFLAMTIAIAPPAAPGAQRSDGDDVAGPLDLARLGFEQSGPRLKLVARTHGRWRPGSLDDRPDLTADRPQSYLCLGLRQGGARRRACVGKKQGKRPHLTLMRIGADGEVASSKRLRDVSVSHPKKRSLRVVGRFRSLKLHVGRLRWRWLSGWGRDQCALPPPRRAPPRGLLPLPLPRNRPGAPPPPPECDDRYPDGHSVDGRVKRPRIVGCTRDEDMVNAHGSRSRKRIALTFDDGPSTYTDNVLDILHRYRVNSTFFVVGENISGRSSLLQRMIRERHEIANHTFHHQYPAGTWDLAATSAKIEDASGFSPCQFRPPGGARGRSSESAAWRLGMSTILWDVDPNDWKRPGSAAIQSRVLGATQPGSIVLMHDGGGDRGQTVAALPQIIRTLKHRGYELVTVTRLLREHVIWRP